MTEAVSVELSDDERSLLRWGLLDWGGPASPTDGLAQVMGFASVADLSAEKYRIAESVWTGKPLSRRDWTRALVATEFVWASDVYGSGLDSTHTSGFSDAEAVVLLRSVQRKLLTAGARISARSLS